MTEKDVCIIGGGITALALTHFLAKQGKDCQAIEKRNRPGGAIYTERRNGHILENGPQRTRLTPVIKQLINNLSLEDKLVTADTDLPLYVYDENKLREAPLSLNTAVKTDLLSKSEKLRVLMEPIKISDDHETVEEFLVHRFGEAAYLKLMGPLYGGIYGSHPAEMSFEHSLGRILRERGINGSILFWLMKKNLIHGVNPPPPISFEEGLQELPEALYRENKDKVELGKEAKRIDKTGEPHDVLTVDGDSISAEKVILTSSAADTANILKKSHPEISDALDELNYNEIAVVHLRSDAELHGMGFQVSLREQSLMTLGCTFNSSMFSNQDIYTSFLGGARNPGLNSQSNDWAMSTAADEFREITGEEAHPIDIHWARMPAYDMSWNALNGISLPDNLFIPTNYMGRPGIPGRIRESKNLSERL